ncbi:AF4/FMR2 family member lilli-like isoform X2 [Macrobrachium nipponense]
MGRAILCSIILTAFFSKAHGQEQRWVWGSSSISSSSSSSSRRSERQLELELELHRPSLLLRPAAAAALLPLAPAAAAAPAAGSISPPAAPFGLVPSEASSLDPHDGSSRSRPPGTTAAAAGDSSSSSSSLHGTETQVSAAAAASSSSSSFQLRPSPLEPLVFRPLSIDISKLPLQSSSEVDAFEEAFASSAFHHPPLSSSSSSAPSASLSREAVHQDLTRGLPLGRPGHPDPIPGIVSSNVFPRDVSGLHVDSSAAAAPVRNSQALVSPPDISILPLEGSSADGRQRFEGQPFAESPVVGRLTQFQVHSPAPPSGRLLFPQRISSLEAINKRQDELFRGTAGKQREMVLPKPTRIFPSGQTPDLDQSPFLKKKIPNGKKSAQQQQPPTRGGGAIRFPKQIKKFSFAPPTQTFPIVEPIAAGSSRDVVSSYALPPPGSSSALAFQQQQQQQEAARELLPNRPTRESRGFVRTPSADESETLTLVFKKEVKPKKGAKQPTYLWVWPRKVSSQPAFTSPAKHAL